jgi:hypothetical protein
MKQSATPRLIICIAIGLSLLSFAYVNIHSACNGHHLTAQPKTEQTRATEIRRDGDEDAKKLSMPDITILTKLVDLARNFVPGR